jgi:hypothetical protein
MGWAENTKKYIKQYIGYIVIVLACLIYIARGIITVEETGKTVMQILGDGFLALFFGLFINYVFELQGMMDGERNEKVIATNQKHAEIVEDISPNIDKLDAWCDKKNKEALKLARIRILSAHGLKYDDCFDEEGVAKPLSLCTKNLQQVQKEERKIIKDKIKGYKKACKVKLTLLTTNLLTSEGGRDYDPYYLGQTKRQYKRKTTTMDLISKLGIACIFGYYGAKFVSTFSWAFLIWTGIQVVLFLIMGVVKLYTSYMFVIDDYRARVIKKIDNLTKFKDYIQNENEQNTTHANTIVSLEENKEEEKLNGENK